MKKEIEYKGYTIVIEVTFNVEIEKRTEREYKIHLVRSDIVNDKYFYKTKTTDERILWDIDVAEKLTKIHIDKIVSPEPSIVDKLIELGFK